MVEYTQENESCYMYIYETGKNESVFEDQDFSAVVKFLQILISPFIM